MAAYPSIGLQYAIKPESKQRVDISAAGTIRSVSLNEDTVYRISITHPLVDSTDRDTLLAFYDTNKANVNTVTLAGDSYNITFAEDYSIKQDSATYFTLSTVVYGVRT